MNHLNNESRRLSKEIKNKEDRKLKGIRKSKHPVLKGLGMLGLIGWTIVVPTLLGTYAGNWLDHHYPSQHSWTITLLLSGLIMGCYGAWFWLSKEKKEIQKDEDETDAPKRE